MPMAETDLAALKEQVLSEVQKELSKPSFDTWFGQVEIVSVEDDSSVVFAVPTAFARDWLETRYTPLLRKVLKQITGSDYAVSFVESTHPVPVTKSASEIMNDIVKMEPGERDKLIAMIAERFGAQG